MQCYPGADAGAGAGRDSGRTYCVLQVAGQDQWGNITAGIELIRKKLPTTGLTPVTPETFAKWKQDRLERKKVSI